MNSSTHKSRPRRPARNAEAGFTILEASMATMILIVGLSAAFNLMVVSVTSNSVANRASGAVALASAQMETLRSTAFTSLTDSPSGVDTLETKTTGFYSNTTIEGLGTFETRWSVQTLTTSNLKYIAVRTEPDGFRGRAARIELTSVRACTAGTTAGCY